MRPGIDWREQAGLVIFWRFRAQEMNTWNHPNLGRFRFNGNDWKGSCKLPAFKVFRYGGSARSKIKLEFETEDEETFPSNRAVAVAERVLKNNKTLVDKIANAIFGDLNGKGKESGMWWYGDLESVLENINSAMDCDMPFQLTSPVDVFKIVGSPSIWIREEVDYYEKPCAVICFSAAFDPEHGLGVLTNGTSILGLGYQMSVSPY